MIKACQQSTYLQLPNPPRHSPACVVMLESFARQALQAEGRAKRQQAPCNPAPLPLVQRGWATVQRAAKVRRDNNGNSEILSTLTEGNTVFVDAVLGKRALIQQPMRGWVVLEKRAGPVLRQEDCQKLQPGEKPALQSVVDDVLMRLCQAPTEAAAAMPDVPISGGLPEAKEHSCLQTSSPRHRDGANDFRSLPGHAWAKIHAAFPAKSLEALHPMQGLGLAFMVLAEPDHQCPGAVLRPKPLNLTDVPQGPAKHSCLQTSSPSHRDGANDFRSLPGHAWAKIHAAFPAKSLEALHPMQGLGLAFMVLAEPDHQCPGAVLRPKPLNLTDVPQGPAKHSCLQTSSPSHRDGANDFRSLPGHAWAKIHAAFPAKSLEALHPMQGLGLPFMVLAEPDHQCPGAVLRPKPLNLTDVPQGPAKHSCLQTSSPSHRDGANDFRSLPGHAWAKIHAAFPAKSLEALHPMQGLGLAFMVLAEPDRQCPGAVLRPKPLHLTDVPQGPAKHSCLQTSSPSHRDGANDFRSLPGHAWAKIHAAFPAKSLQADLCMLPGAAGTETRNFPKVCTMHPSAGRSGQSPLQGGPFLSGMGLGFVVLAVPGQHMLAIKLLASLHLPPAPQHAASGDFRTLPSSSWQKLHANFPGPSSSPGTGHTELRAAPTADDGMPTRFMALREAVRKAVCCQRRLRST